MAAHLAQKASIFVSVRPTCTRQPARSGEDSFSYDGATNT
jgi:hypothetical protein